jgi:ATP-dependent Clp protease, protease subunit
MIKTIRLGEDMKEREQEGPIELAIVGDITEHESDLFEKLLEVEPRGECVIYFDSLGGSAYAAVALASVIRLRGLRATGIVVGECTSAALWPLAACRRRLVTPLSVLLFHPMKWQSEENVALAEAAEWARHFSALETDMDRLLAELFGTSVEQIKAWSYPGRYVSGREMVEAGLAEMVELDTLPEMRRGR